ncbi:MAG: sterol desaturase family protein [Pseudomonadota bacterium]
MQWLELLTLALLPAFLIADFFYRARREPSVAGWRLRAGVFTALSFALSLATGALWATVFDGKSLLDGASLGIAGGALAGILCYELCHYAYHRSAHSFRWLWRIHQMHHSAETLDAWGAYYLHPLDAVFFVTWSSLVMFPLLGLAPEAGAVAVAFITFAGIFQHANLKTPRWLGFIVQRPESHAIHHARAVHHENFADLPLLDMLFGTFNNPRHSVEKLEQGFYFGASRRWLESLLLRDVTSPRQP